MSMKNDAFDLTANLALTALAARLRNGLPSGAQAQVAALGTAPNTFFAAKATSDVDSNLSPNGKLAAAQAAANTARVDISTWEAKYVGGLDKQLAAARTASLAKVGALVAEPTALQVSTMVQRLQAFDPLEVEILYAGGTDDERHVIEVCAEQLGRQPRRRADGQVTWEPIIAPERIAESVLARVERLDAEGARAIRDLEAIRNCYAGLVGTARTLINEALPSHQGAAA
jgi:hypothetical protein